MAHLGHVLFLVGRVSESIIRRYGGKGCGASRNMSHHKRPEDTWKGSGGRGDQRTKTTNSSTVTCE